jgi:hypothetical protein
MKFSLGLGWKGDFMENSNPFISLNQGKDRSYLKNAFWPNTCVGFSFQVLDILAYACGLKPGPALILN